jgi:uncharacterized protein (TIGR01777 family)
MTETFRQRIEVDCSPAELFQWHERPGAFQRLNPPFEPVTVRSATGGIRDGARVELGIPIGPGPLRHIQIPWRLEHRDYIAGQRFCDVQIAGPFRAWRHTHSILPGERGGAILDDTIEYALPFGALGQALGGWLVRQKLTTLFRYRHTITRNDIALSKAYPAARGLKVLISGASGLVGSELSGLLSVLGHSVSHLVRRPARNENEISWDPIARSIEHSKLGGFDAVVNLAGENIAGGRWTSARKAALRSSRIDTTNFLLESLTATKAPPTTFISASAIGIYGSRREEALDERASLGQGFLADLAKEWEDSARQASQHGMRVAHMRFGIILSARGGALQKMLPPFQLGLGGPLGDGRGVMSWIALDDAVGAIYATLLDERLNGAINTVSPQPCTNKEFTATLARVLRRPALLPVPVTMLKLALGELAEEALLSSIQVTPRKLTDSGYRFLFPDLEGALRHLLGRR